jgi:predicted phage tail protein
MENDFNETRMVVEDSHRSHKTAIVVLAVGLAVALAGDGYLLVRANHLNDDIAQTQSGTQTQISKLNEATTTLLEQEKQRLQDMEQQMKDQVKGVSDSANVAIRRARAEAHKQGEDLSGKLSDQQQQVATQLSQIQDTTNSKFTAVSTDVDGVKANVETVKTTVAAAQSDIEKTSADLKRAMGDMGVMSGLIATNAKDLDTLRALGERNYFEFDITKKDAAKKVGDLMLTLKKSDPKRSRFTLDVLADDRHVEKKDKTINEPVQLYVSGNMQPYEIVINQVTKDHVTGYLATPKVKMARR